VNGDEGFGAWGWSNAAPRAPLAEGRGKLFDSAIPACAEAPGPKPLVTPRGESMHVECLTCTTPLSKETLEDAGIVHCPTCGDRFVLLEALTIVAEIPHDEYLGG
jgi:DNA-directed RNA polymerase subunit RPC12/RpoP